MKNTWIISIFAALSILFSYNAQSTLLLSNGDEVLSLSTESDIVFDIQGGQLVGAFNVNVNGTFYDVAFQDGSFIDIFGGTTGLDARTVTQSLIFSTALDAFVFVDNNAGLFDTDSTLTFGCNSSRACSVYTPYDIAGINVFFSTVDNFNGSAADSIRFSAENTLRDSSLFGTFTYANWQLTQVRLDSTPVPEPSSIVLCLFGILGLVAKRKKI
ncbi:PEP-CTERM sorting domain-containing protein [Alteromonadaceae bacterium M269]|nr:PEP-CTERM sorting domain-containing protein [Alteromonadaceae bacterium M269]